ncbi:CRISPR-associated protein Cas5 [Cetobacterium sp.]|uniref:CRISPR-associated protein Cas5 n=1 Tax=Cetobacterium sp. TaxID=2071632 RepID=UPI003F2EA558
MEILKISLGGRIAHFGINGTNDKNNRYSFQHITGSNIKGILGAIAGYKGWNDLDKKASIPEFLEKLKDLEYGVIPKKFKFNSTIQKYSNTTGVNKGDNIGTSLQISEEFLEEVSWDIYLKNLPLEVKDNILNRVSIYPISLGKKGCFINKFDIEILKGYEIESNKVESIFPVEFLKEEDLNLEFNLLEDDFLEEDFVFLYSEDFFQETKNYAISKNILKENVKCVSVDEKNIYMIGGNL